MIRLKFCALDMVLKPYIKICKNDVQCTHIHIVIYLTCDLLDENENNAVFTINAPYIVWFVALQKSSAKHLATRRFSQKGFVDLDFGHR